ncbi:MAG: acyltransferase [Akkermansiaceae bacterium]|nr:acyltransferase [Akkermansiaceae bacterium]MDP4778834.1 acyltransferase [Akkermansiaceae bacterium]MDP4846965.1 acyltransferase [Akkermansiaceae bacterium]MDP4997031.1 acyltransferase [Akkermansiaceae bacterium]
MIESPPKQVVRQLDSLTGLRTLMAGMVILCHGWIRSDLMPSELWISQIVGEMGHCGVAGFFVLSGYILAHVYRDRKWSSHEFAVNRFARIYPLYLLGLIFTLPMDWISPGMSAEGRGSALSLSVVLMQSWFPYANGRFNGPGWTLSVEALFYGLFPILFLIWRKSHKLFLWLTIGAAALTAILWDPDSFFQRHRFPPMRVWEFMLGMALAVIPLRSNRLLPRGELLPLFIVFLCPVVAAALHHTPYPFLKWLAMVVVSGLAIILLAARDTTTDKDKWSFFRLRWMILGGEISYGIYLLHDGVQRYARVGFERILDTPLQDAPIFLKIGFLLSTSIVVILLALVSWVKIEIPARKFIRKRFASRG